MWYNVAKTIAGYDCDFRVVDSAILSGGAGWVATNVSVRTILLIEDALDLARVIHRELEAAGYRVLHATEGLAGVMLHASQNPDLVIL